jgi:hypothetical protein
MSDNVAWLAKLGPRKSTTIRIGSHAAVSGDEEIGQGPVPGLEELEITGKFEPSRR